MIRFANLLQAPTVSIYQLVKTITFVLYLFDMVEMNKMKMKMKWCFTQVDNMSKESTRSIQVYILQRFYDDLSAKF